MKEPVGKGQAGVGFTVVYETDPGLPPDLRIGIRTDYESGDYVTHYIAPAVAPALQVVPPSLSVGRRSGRRVLLDVDRPEHQFRAWAHLSANSINVCAIARASAGAM